MGFMVLLTEVGSPVSGASSTYIETDLSSATLISAGILSPMRTSTISPGTRLTASDYLRTPSLST